MAALLRPVACPRRRNTGDIPIDDAGREVCFHIVTRYPRLLVEYVIDEEVTPNGDVDRQGVEEVVGLREKYLLGGGAGLLVDLLLDSC